jgi:hypothetical protein
MYQGMAWRPRYKVVKREGSQVRVQVQVQALECICVRGCGTLHIACHITHKHAGCDEWGYSGGWNRDCSNQDRADVNGREALWTAWLSRALSVCTYLSHVP